MDDDEHHNHQLSTTVSVSDLLVNARCIDPKCTLFNIETGTFVSVDVQLGGGRL